MMATDWVLVITRASHASIASEIIRGRTHLPQVEFVVTVVYQTGRSAVRVQVDVGFLVDLERAETDDVVIESQLLQDD